MKALSLFANIGVSEAYLKDIGVQVVLANEIDGKRSKIYSHLYPETEMVCGDITKPTTQDEIIKKSIEYKVDVVMATPPCQGMSTAGKMDKNDVRNGLIKYAIEIIKKVMPKYVFLENVPVQLLTQIECNGIMINIPEYIGAELGDKYIINQRLINVCNYGVAQTRERAIFLLTKNDEELIWDIPPKEENVVTLYDIIGKLPILDPFVKDISYSNLIKMFPDFEVRKKQAIEISRWHSPPKHVYRQVIAMMHTPTGHSAFENEKFKPAKDDGTLVRGYKNTYKRQNWNMPAYTITMYNKTIGSQNNAHPGRMIGYDENGEELYSDPRVLTLYEIILAMSLPTYWNLPEDISESYLRSIIGEGIPPLFVKKVFQYLLSK